MKIWTGSSESMNLLIQHEYYRQLRNRKQLVRKLEFDAVGLDIDE